MEPFDTCIDGEYTYNIKTRVNVLLYRRMENDWTMIEMFDEINDERGIQERNITDSNLLVEKQTGIQFSYTI